MLEELEIVEALLGVDAEGCACCSRELRNLVHRPYIVPIRWRLDNADLGDKPRLAELKLL